MQLTVAMVRSLRTRGWFSDGDGLFLEIRPNGRRYWVFRYQRAGRAHVMSFGNADVVSLAEARRRHMEARTSLANGIDPLEARRQSSVHSNRSFAATTEHYIDGHRAAWRGRRTEAAWRQSLVMHAYPAIGNKSVDVVDVDDILRILQPIWSTKPVVAAQVRYRIEAVLDYAAARGWRADANPAAWRGRLRSLLPARSKFHVVLHRAALPWAEMPALMATLRKTDSMAAKCLRFCILTATRSAEATGTRWEEIDVATATWTIPARRTKTGKPHRVPLADPAMAILRELAAVRSPDPLVFMGRALGQPLAGTTLSALLRKLAPEVTVHGTARSTFRDWAADHGHSSEAAEAALAHAPPGRVQAAYMRSDLYELRRGLMADWASYLSGTDGIVLALRRTA